MGAIEVLKCVYAGIVREVNCVGIIRIGCEAGVLDHTPVKDYFKHMWISPVPTARLVVGFLAEAMIGDVRAEIVKGLIFRTVR